MIKRIVRPATMALLMGASLALAGCASGPTVSYVNPNSVDTTTINFGSTDLQTLSQSMLNQMLSAPSVINITDKNQQPVIFIGGINNNTDQHIDTQSITNAISTRLINSGKFRFADPSAVNKVEQQLNYQQSSGLVNPKTAVKIGEQIGAHYMLYGDLSSINQTNSNQQSLFFQFTLKLLNIQSGIIVWQGEKQIRKIAERKSFGW